MSVLRRSPMDRTTSELNGLGPGKGTWTCHICGRERPDRFIAVRMHRTEWATGGWYLENVRYCVDRPACAAGAETFRFVQPGAFG